MNVSRFRLESRIPETSNKRIQEKVNLNTALKERFYAFNLAAKY